MANTYTYGDVINAVASSIPRVREESLAPTVCNMATGLIWNSFDWRETIKELPPFWLSPDAQDYGPPAVIVPTDFQGLREARLAMLTSQPPLRVPLKVVRSLEKTHARALPSTICYQKDKEAFRIFPKPPTNIGAPFYYIEGTYKFLPTKVTNTNYATTLLFSDDQYFYVWVEVVKWAYKSLTGSQDVPVALQVAKAVIMEMANNEGLNLGDTPFSPAEPLVAGGRWGNYTGLGFWGF